MPVANSPQLLRRTTAACCAPKPALAARPVLGSRQASALRDLFQVLADRTRLRLLHALVREPELCVSDLCEVLAMRPQAVSNQLRRLAAQHVVSARRDGRRVLYRISDPCVPSILDRGLCLLEDAGEPA